MGIRATDNETVTISGAAVGTKGAGHKRVKAPKDTTGRNTGVVNTGSGTVNVVDTHSGTVTVLRGRNKS